MVTSLSRPRIQPPKPGELLFTGNDWDFETIRRIHDACEAVAGPELGLSWYPNQIARFSMPFHVMQGNLRGFRQRQATGQCQSRTLPRPFDIALERH